MPSARPRAPRVALVAAEFNRPLVDAMIASALDEVRREGAVAAGETLRVPGSYETPVVAAALIARRDVDAVVVLGYIERGETQHGEVMGHAVHGALVGLAVEHGKPVGIGIIGPGATAAQADGRKDAYARAAVRAALRAREAIGRARKPAR